MGWFDWFKKPKQEAAPMPIAKKEKTRPLVQETLFIASTLDGGSVRHFDFCDEESVKAAARVWANTVEDAYSCAVHWGPWADLIDTFKIGDKWPWSYEGPNFITYSGVVTAPDRQAAYSQIKLKLREALGVTHLGRIELKIGDQLRVYVDTHTITLP